LSWIRLSYIQHLLEIFFEWLCFTTSSMYSLNFPNLGPWTRACVIHESDPLISHKQGGYFLKLETVVLRRWGSETQNFGLINWIDKITWLPKRDWRLAFRALALHHSESHFIPLQFVFGHSWLSDPDPGHSSPPFWGAGLLHRRVRTCDPLLQNSVSEHALKGLHWLHAPFTTSLNDKNNNKHKEY